MAAKFDASFFEGKLPLRRGLGSVALGSAGRHVSREFFDKARTKLDRHYQKKHLSNGYIG